MLRCVDKTTCCWRRPCAQRPKVGDADDLDANVRHIVPMLRCGAGCLCCAVLLSCPTFCIGPTFFARHLRDLRARM
jgi:hypothetical protein